MANPFHFESSHWKSWKLSRPSFLLLLFAFCVSLPGILSANEKAKPFNKNLPLPELNAYLDQRAKEIEPMLSDNFCVLPPITDREFWTQMAERPSMRGLVKRVENDLKTPVAVVPDELYLEFSKNGNRSNYQNAYGRRNSGLPRAVLAECFENQGRFIPRIEEHLKAYFGDRSWVLPAHDGNLANFNGKYNIDLVSSASAWTLATVGAVLGDKLSKEVRDELDRQLEIRCFKPFRDHIKTGSPGLGWVRSIFNWNAVCLAGVSGAALTNIKSKEERAWFLAACENFIKCSDYGYTDDGYCSEGVGYWNYGFGHHISMSETVSRATGGKIQILDNPKLRIVALYGFTIEILPGISPSFADCGMTSNPSRQMLAYLNRYYGFGLDNYDFTLPISTHNLVDLGLYGANLIPPPGADGRGFAPKVGAMKDEVSPISNRKWFDQAQIMVWRQEGWKTLLENVSDGAKLREAREALPGFAAAMKGGHNGEAHNHNDVGSYVLIYRGQLPALDLGGEVYTRRTFSKDRYVSDVLNSWGHNVPIVAGNLQKTGARYAAKVLETKTGELETLKLDIAGAYDVKACKKLTREFTYSRKVTLFTVQDDVEFDSPQSFEVPMVTILSWKRDGNAVILGEGEKAVRAEIEVKIDGKVSNDWTLNEGKYEADFAARAMARRLAVVLNEPVKNASVKITYTPVQPD